MKGVEHVYRLHDLLKSSRYPVSVKSILRELECSLSSFHRTRQFLKNILGAPLIYDYNKCGYCYKPEEKKFELPGIWLNDKEIAALVTLESLASEQSGMFRYLLEPIRARLRGLAQSQEFPLDELRRLRILPIGSRGVPELLFKQTAEAVLTRRRLRFDYTNSKGEITNRIVSSQRLVRYRDNWYLDGWCHLKKGLRTFSLNRISNIDVLIKPAKKISDAILDKHLGESYGIFAGRARGEAHLIFNSKVGLLVSQEKWHPRQQSCFLPDGRYELKFPFGDPTELIMDVMRYGEAVEVVGPEELREQIKNRIGQMAKIYEK